MATAIKESRFATVPKAAAGFEPTIPIQARYDNWIGGECPRPGEVPSSTPRRSRDSRCAKSPARLLRTSNWRLTPPMPPRTNGAKTSPGDRARVLNKIADRMEERQELLAFVESCDNGKPIRETTAADLPLAIDHFRYFAGCIRAQEGTLSQIDADTVAYHFHEPLGVVGQIIPWNFPLLMAAWKLAPALAAGNCVVLKPAEQTPMGVLC